MIHLLFSMPIKTRGKNNRTIYCLERDNITEILHNRYYRDNLCANLRNLSNHGAIGYNRHQPYYQNNEVCVHTNRASATYIEYTGVPSHERMVPHTHYLCAPPIACHEIYTRARASIHAYGDISYPIKHFIRALFR